MSSRRAGCVIAAVAAGGMALAGCSAGKSPSGAVESRASAAASAANGLPSATSPALAEASSVLANIKGGQDSKTEVSLGKVTTASGAGSEVTVTVNNHQPQSYRYIVQINFTDQSGNALDAIVVQIPEVAAGANTQAVARSNRKLPSTATAAVGAALRY